MPSADFVHLHVHTEYSMLDGAARVDELFEEAARLGQRSLAITDHGYLFGAYDFWSRGSKAGLKPIVGIEAYLTPGTARADRTRVRWGDGAQVGDDVSASGAYTHATLWARDNTGLHNLLRLASLASLEGHFYKPRMDREILERFAEGLIATTGCPSGEVQTRLRLGQYEEALRAAREMRDIFGRENFYVEIMDHGLEIERRVAQDLVRIARDVGVPLVATNDSHYTRAEDAAAHEALLCIQSGSTLADAGRFRFEGSSYYLRSSDDMRRTFEGFEGACDSTLEIADRCEVTFDRSRDLMPRFSCPAGETEHSWFVAEVQRGLEARYPGGVPENVKERAEFEMGVITTKGYAGYYLVVADFVRWAKAQRIRVGPGRGSGAGSMAAYAMGITDIDPIVHGLFFERFLNPERESRPDFDIDFDERRRGEVMRYVTDKYGDDKVAQVVTYGTIKAKQALKDAARVLGKPYALGEKLTKGFPEPLQGRDMSLAAAFDPRHDRFAEAQDFRALVDAEEGAPEVLALARGLENLKRQWGVHAAGVIMSAEPLIDTVPIMRREQDGAIITQFDYPMCEDLGLIKMDFLGLRTLTLLDDALVNIIGNGKDPVVLEELALADPATFELLGRGDTLGVFQLDGVAMRQLLRQMKPDSFEDISACLALYRPGPMGVNSHTNYAARKNGLQRIDPIHPELAGPLNDVLEPTYGLIVYQEQVLRVAQIVAGYSLGRADLLRKAMGKKDKAVLDKEFEPFGAGMRERGFSDDAVTTLWEVLVPFADYAFNKAHTVAYGVLSFWTAYLKANYRVEFMAALLTSVGSDKERSALYLAECRRMGITVLPPDVNDSRPTYAAVGDDIRFGLTAVRNVGAGVVGEIIRARTEKGRFTSFPDFLEKVPSPVCNKRTIDSLIKAGAFDSLGATRRGLNTIHEQAVDAVVGVKRQEATGQFDLFGGEMDLGPRVSLTVPTVEEWDRKTLLGFEREMLGLYVSDHPLRGLERVLRAEATHQIVNATHAHGIREGDLVVFAGLVTHVDRRLARSGNAYGIVTLEDMTAEAEVSFFGKTYDQYARDLADDAVLVIKSRVRERGDGGIQFSAIEVKVPTIAAEDSTPVTITVPASRVTAGLVRQIEGILREHPGAVEVRMILTGQEKPLMMRLDDAYRVSRSSALYGDLKAALGPSCLAS